MVLMADLLCYKCNTKIIFGDLVSKSGKSIPINPSTLTPHKCQENKKSSISLEDRVSKLEQIVKGLIHP